MTTLKEQVAQKNKNLFQKKKSTFKNYVKADTEEISEIISDKLLAIIKKNVC